MLSKKDNTFDKTNIYQKDIMDRKEHDLNAYKDFIRNKNKKQEKEELYKKIETEHEERKERLEKIEKVKQELLKNHKPTNINKKIKKINIHENIKEKKQKKKEQDYFNKLIDCKSCGNKVNPLAEICPNCGWKVTSTQKVIQGIFEIVIIGSLFYWLFIKGKLFSLFF